MKIRQLSVLTGGALAATLAGGVALAAPAAHSPLTSQQTTAAPTVLADMACGAGGCGGNMKKKSDQTDNKSDQKS